MLAVLQCNPEHLRGPHLWPRWCSNSFSLSCGPGRKLEGHTCEDVDECLWRPCLHGGSCYNLRPGYLCVCGPGHTGDNCEWGSLASGGHPLTAPLAIAALTLSLLLLVVLGVVFSIRLHRQWLSRALAGRQVSDVGDAGGVGGEEGTIIAVKGGRMEEGSGTRLKDDPDNDSFLQCLKFNLEHAHPSTQKKAEEDPARPDSGVVSLQEEPPSGAGKPARVAIGGTPEPLLPRDDLRAYAYEGDGSSAGSLSSAISGLRVELDDGGNIKPLVSEFLEVMDLLKNLPEASKSSLLIAPKLEGDKCIVGGGGGGGDARACGGKCGSDQSLSPTSHPPTTTTPRVSKQAVTPTPKSCVAASPLSSKRESRHTTPRPVSSPHSKEELSTVC
ncbi:neural-cadherin-like isoform X1 [Homarus americanus]|uniref:neural-cadherin-like isoform X1 n=1 Tax=Homarus americanus TaxID=6706 RepID=UPI001C49625F|nr:neural-cadherin-like isoform X1 [Homarus americanus]